VRTYLLENFFFSPFLFRPLLFSAAAAAASSMSVNFFYFFLFNLISSFKNQNTGRWQLAQLLK